MPINASIPLSYQGIDIGKIMDDAERHKALRAQREGIEAENARRGRLADLLPKAVGGDSAATNEIAGIDPEMFLKLDERQRKMLADRTEDLSAAVRWADTPEKWQYVQQHYGQQGVDLSPYSFDQRERGLVSLGRLGEYLKDAPKPPTPTAMEQNYNFIAGKDQKLADSYLRSQADPVTWVRTEDSTGIHLTPVPRSGPGAPGQARQINSREEYEALPPGTPYIAPDGSRRVKGGQTPQASGNFLP